jgi:spermidine synthase
MTIRTSPSILFYTGVFIMSGLLMALQIVQSRIFSVTTWYHISFLVIGVAMFGLTLGALKIHRGNEAEQRRHYGRDMAAASFRFAVGMIVGLVGQLAVPVVSDDLYVTLVALPVVAAMTLPAYYYAGAVLSLAITRAPYPAARTYGFDLLGAAAGCLFALFMMNVFDGPSAIMVLALLALAALRCFGKAEGVLPAVVTGVILFALCLNVLSPRPVIYPLWVKKHSFPEASLAYDRWNSISRVMVEAESRDAPPYLWGPSTRLPASVKTSWYELLIDGDASTPINRWSGDRGAALHFLDYDVTTIAYALPGLKSAGIIGLGGGRDVLSSLHAGAKTVTALDVNNIQVSLLSKIEPFKSYAAIGERKDVRLINSEARSWFASNPDTFDLIQMSLVDTWAATGAGAFALSENGLYTVEAWNTFFQHLNPGGVMTVSRWYMKDAQSEGERLVSLTMGTLFKAGVKEPKKHIFMATARRIVTMVLSRDPFTKAQLDAMEKRAKEMAFDVLISPRKGVAGTEFAGILDAKSREELEALAAGSVYDISPPTDRRPFFFNQVRMGDPRLVLQLASQTGQSAMVGHAHAIANLYIIILFSLLMVVFAIVYPLRAEVKAGNRFIKAGTAWFVLIGLGFMLLEIALMQRMSVYLGHPAYGLGIVLFSLVLSTGCGSLISDMYPLKTNRHRIAWALGTALAISLSVFFIDAAMTAFSGAGLFARALICVSVTAPLGILMGYGFPTGMEMARQAHARSTAWFWGINGAAGVMGSSVAIAINIGAGLDRAMFIAALCYALLAIAGNRPERKA